jgi:hypothetical protein
MPVHLIELVVRGRLGQSVAGALVDFDVETSADGLTTILGTIADQSELLGLMQMFSDLNVEVVSVKTVE